MIPDGSIYILPLVQPNLWAGKESGLVQWIRDLHGGHSIQDTRQLLNILDPPCFQVFSLVLDVLICTKHLGFLIFFFLRSWNCWSCIECHSLLVPVLLGLIFCMV